MFKFNWRDYKSMQGLNNMKARIDYLGGKSQVDRMVADKLHSLRKAM